MDSRLHNVKSGESNDEEGIKAKPSLDESVFVEDAMDSDDEANAEGSTSL
jgi:hypothetical protein